MKEQDIILCFREFLEKQKKEREQGNPYSAKEYIIEDYSKKYQEEDNTKGKAVSEQERRKDIEARIQAWEQNEAEFENMTERLSYSAELNEWQAAEMLDNVIQELMLSPSDTYKYLSNVKKMIYNNLLERMPKQIADTWKQDLETEYENEWNRAEEEVSEDEIQALFAETAFLLRYAGMSYEEETQRILAETAIGKETTLKIQNFGEAERDIRLLTNYLVSEMVLADEQSPYTKEEQQAIVECAVPVYTTAQSYIQKGVDAEYIMKLAQSYIGKVFSSKNIKTAVGLAAVILAVKTVWSLAMLAVTGAVAVVGTSILWSLCKKLRESFSSSESTKSVYEMLKKKVESLREQYQKYERRSKYRNDQKEKEHWMQEKWEEDSEDWQEEENNDVF